MENFTPDNSITLLKRKTQGIFIDMSDWKFYKYSPQYTLPLGIKKLKVRFIGELYDRRYYPYRNEKILLKTTTLEEVINLDFIPETLESLIIKNLTYRTIKDETLLRNMPSSVKELTLNSDTFIENFVLYPRIKILNTNNPDFILKTPNSVEELRLTNEVDLCQMGDYFSKSPKLKIVYGLMPNKTKSFIFDDLKDKLSKIGIMISYQINLDVYQHLTDKIDNSFNEKEFNFKGFTKCFRIERIIS